MAVTSRSSRSSKAIVCLLAFLGTMVSLSASASPALAESPWWHLSTGSRPTYLKAGVARDEVRKLTVQATAGSYFLEEPVAIEHGEVVEGQTYAQVPFNAGAPEVELALAELYGLGNVEVSEEPGGAREFLITFKGARDARPVRLAGEGEVTITQEVEGRPDGEIYVTAENLGDVAVDGAEAPIKLSDALPPGLRAVAVAGTEPGPGGDFLKRDPLSCSLKSLTCTSSGDIAPFDELEFRVAVVVESGASGELENGARITGGEGFACKEVSDSSGTFSDAGCVRKASGANFGLVSTGPVVPTTASHRVVISQVKPPFGAEDYELLSEEEGGSPAIQAGSHPFQLTTAITLNQGTDIAPVEHGTKPKVSPAALAKDLHFKWPAGLIGNPSAFPQCTDSQFFKTIEANFNECSPQSAVGVVALTVHEPLAQGDYQIPAPLFNLVPEPGEPARFGFFVPLSGVWVEIDTSVRSGGDYGVTVSSNNITQGAGLISSNVTVWGVPGDPRHNRQRGWSCLGESRGNFVIGELSAPCSSAAAHASEHPAAFLSLPTSCSSGLESSVVGDSWDTPGVFSVVASSSLPVLDGCNRLPFSPSIRVTPDGMAGSTPTGLNVDVHVPQEETLNATGLAEAAPRDITVSLPEGVAVNPSGGDGLVGCSEVLAGFTGFAEFDSGVPTATFTERLASPLLPGVNVCPDASKIGTVKIKTPILPNPIEGAVYLASQNANPFGGLVAIYLIAEDPVSGVVIKLAGETNLTATGQVVATFHNSPQAPFEDAELHFFGGERAPLTTPARCGAYTTTASITPWSGNPASVSSSTFNVTSGPNGTPCPGQSLPFSPSLTGGTTNIDAGAYSPLTTTIGREDGQQDLQSVVLHMPAGLEGKLAGVKLCPEAQANEGTCGPESLIGETTVSAGVGSDPVTVKGGRVYLTETYAGAPYGLSIVNPVKAGPFDLEHDTSNPANQPACDCVVVRAKILVDPQTAQLTVITDPAGPHAIPHLIDGIPVQIKNVNVTIAREHFTFNPTSCAPMSITGDIASDEGGTSALTVPFQATNCAVLKFAPKLAVSVGGHASRSNGASLGFKISYPKGAQGTQSWFSEAKFDIPRQLPARLTTIQQACLAKTFETNRGACPKHSIIGKAIVHTPVLPVPLEGPVYFVSYGGAKFPDAVIALKGYGLNIELHGATFINGKTGVTSATFKRLPDVPFESIEVNLPTGPYSEFGANLPTKAHNSFCNQKLTMPTLLKAQNGLQIKQNTPLTTTNCTKHKAKTSKKRKRK
jgi:hypothetical protein